MLLPVSRDDATGQIWGLYSSGKQIKPDPVSRDDVTAKIWGLYRTGKQTTPDPALRPSSRHKSTWTPAPPSPARRSMPSTMTPAHGVHASFVVILEPSDESSTIKMVSFLTQTSENSRFAPNDQRSAPNNPLSAMIPISDQEILSRRNHSQNGRRNQSSPLRDKMKLGFLVMGCPNTGPLKLQKPNCISCDPNHFLQKPRSVLKTFLSIISPSLYDLSKSIDRRRQLQRQSSALLWLYKNTLRSLPLDPIRLGYYESKSLKITDIMLLIPRRRESILPVEEDWKKAQVDSKKILAQPHQSTTANPSPKPICINMIGIIGDILSIAKSVHDFSIRFIPRSEIMFDDLATAVWSMTLGHNISLYFCFV